MQIFVGNVWKSVREVEAIQNVEQSTVVVIT